MGFVESFKFSCLRLSCNAMFCELSGCVIDCMLVMCFSVRVFFVRSQAFVRASWSHALCDLIRWHFRASQSADCHGVASLQVVALLGRDIHSFKAVPFGIGEFSADICKFNKKTS